ncbi:hypothetical protein D9615_003433 [Tricholomella constricta]|uniref:Uncharacterized protein n=1 Tax=Tricholomella constricta TaxID=117010 RepID=A0A8H5M848_9AGAR|nr:hypothetical protein D9615_003433 [Tricholomella constricta]
MLRCRELSKLSKAPRAKSVNFRRQTPGSVADLLKPANVPFRPNYLDPTHPATSIPKQKFPGFKTDALGIRAYPHALLSPPEHVWTTPSNDPIDPWKARVGRFLSLNAELEPGAADQLALEPMTLNNSKKNRVPMSFINATSKKRTSNKRHIRHKIASRMKIAINLIVSRGADTIESNGKRRLVMNEKEAETLSDKWISPGWTYIFFPTLEIYRMPYHDMIPMLRMALRRIWQQSQAMETVWERRVIEGVARPGPVKHSTQGPKARNQPYSQRAAATKVSHRLFSTTSAASTRKSIENPSIIDTTTFPKQKDTSAPLATSTNVERKFAPRNPHTKSERVKESDDTSASRSSQRGTTRKLRGLREDRPFFDPRPEAEFDHDLYTRNFPRPKTSRRPFGLRETCDASELDTDERYIPKRTPIFGPLNEKKLIRLAGVDFTQSPVAPVRDHLAAARPLSFSSQAVKEQRDEIFNLERDSAETLLGDAKQKLYRRIKNIRKRNRSKALNVAEDVPVHKFLGFDIPPAPSFDPFPDVDPVHETPLQCSTSKRPSLQLPYDSKMNQQTSPRRQYENALSPKQQLIRDVASFDPFSPPSQSTDPVSNSDAIDTTTPTADTSPAVPLVPDFDPFYTATMNSDTLPASPSETGTPQARLDSRDRRALLRRGTSGARSTEAVRTTETSPIKRELCSSNPVVSSWRKSR